MDEPNTLDRVRGVLNQRRSHILALYRAAGIGIGKAEPSSSSYLITVYLESNADRPTEPVSVDGVPLQFKVTGQIRPLRPH